MSTNPIDAFPTQGIVRAEKGVPRNTIAKVAVKLELGPFAPVVKVPNQFPQLLELDQKRPLAAVIQELALGWQLKSAEHYALQWDAQDHPHYLHYVTERNRNEVKDGNVLRLTSSAGRMAAEILNRLKTATSANESRELRDISQHLARLSGDNTFATEFIQRRGLTHLLSMVETGAVSGEASAALLSAFMELMDHGHVSWDVIEEAFVQQVATNVSSICRSPSAVSSSGGNKAPNLNANQVTVLINSLLILEGVITNGADRVKMISKCVPLEDVLHHIETSPRVDVQTAALALLNAFFIKSNKTQSIPTSAPRGSHPPSLSTQVSYRELFDPLMLHSIRNAVYEKILRPSKDGHLKPEMMHQLQVLEACMLFTLTRRMHARMERDDDLERAKIVELRQVAFEHLDFDGSATVSARSTKATSITGGASTLSSSSSSPFAKDWAKKLGFTNAAHPWEDFDVSPPGLLALDNLIYLARNHVDDFRRLVLENSRFDVNDHECPVIRSCIALTKCICEVLKVGQPPLEAEHAQLFHPFFFSHDDAFHEFFCVCTRLVNKTWKEMRASANDFNKVMAVVREQIVRALHAQPETVEDIKKEFDNLAYNRIMELRTKEIVARDDKEFQAKPIQDLRKALEVELMDLVRVQRLNSLAEGSWFNKNAKRTARDKYRFCRLSSDHKFLQYDDFTDMSAESPPAPEKLLNKVAVVDIKNILKGKNCPFLSRQRGGQRSLFAFSLQLESEPSDPVFLDFLALDDKTFDVWTDGLGALLSQPPSSQSARENLDMLLDMEIKIQMLDAEGISIPETPPPIPEDPPDFDFLPIDGME